MFNRKSGLALLLIIAVVTVVFVSIDEAQSSYAFDSGAKFMITLSNVSFEKEWNGLSLRCNVILRNNTRKKIFVESVYYSAFNELGLVLMDKEGRTVYEEPHSYYLSVFSFKPRSFELQQGNNKSDLIFAVVELPVGMKQFKAQIKASFVLEDNRPLVSNVIDVSIP